MTKVDIVRELIVAGPNRTARELAQALHGTKGYQQQVNQQCEMLAYMGEVERRGTGGPADPYRYFPKCP